MNILSGLPAEEYGTLKTSLRTRVDPINMEYVRFAKMLDELAANTEGVSQWQLVLESCSAQSGKAVEESL
ncbi:hypothetical protein EJ110_NYTH30912 [Nymphaea thermarum]|nr:hypothetical protein EJ110_NYTH30912 [Nymphaea thermarum]